MKLFAYAAALALITGIAPLGVVGTAEAGQAVRERTVVTTRTTTALSGYRAPVRSRYDRPRVRTRKVCRTERRNGRRIQVCRTIRVRR